MKKEVNSMRDLDDTGRSSDQYDQERIIIRNVTRQCVLDRLSNLLANRVAAMPDDDARLDIMPQYYREHGIHPMHLIPSDKV